MKAPKKASNVGVDEFVAKNNVYRARNTPRKES